VQTFYQPLFSNSPFAISLQQSFSLPKASHTKKPKAQSKGKKKKPQSKSLAPSFSESFISSGKQGGAAVLGEGRDIVTGEMCHPVSLNINNLEAAVMHFPFLWLGLCLSWPTDNLRKNS
jgi:hypothetical protein